MSAREGFLQAIVSPTPFGLLVAVIFAISTPLFLHYVVFRVRRLSTLPSILLIGPSGSGKTTLLTLLVRGSSVSTHTSQTPACVECSLPVKSVAGSDEYRSKNDPANLTHKQFLLVDTPGHGKLRHHALQQIEVSQNFKGIIFLVDAASLAADGEGLRRTADYLYDVLLILQKAVTRGKIRKAQSDVGVLIAANKMDLFTALPAALVKNHLEVELTRIRFTRSKGLLDSGIGMNNALDEEKDDWLGEVGSATFKLTQLEEFNISVTVLGGSVVRRERPSTEEWWAWISDRL